MVYPVAVQQPAVPLAPHAATFAAEPTVTIATKGAFDVINRLFNSQLSPGAAGCSVADHTLHGLGLGHGGMAGGGGGGMRPEPTVTLHTREAFDEINSMFQAELPRVSRKVWCGSSSLALR